MSNNLTLTMKYFGELTLAERQLFLNVVTTDAVKVKKPKPKKKELSYRYSEEYFYETLKAGWNEGVRKRKALEELREQKKKRDEQDKELKKVKVKKLEMVKV